MVDRQQRLVEQGAAACAEDEEVEALVAICRQRYTEVVGAAHSMFLRAAEQEGWPPEGIPRQTQVFDKYVAPALEERRKLAYFLVDSMRYEMGRDLGGTLDSFGPVTIATAATILPTTTGFFVLRGAQVIPIEIIVDHAVIGMSLGQPQQQRYELNGAFATLLAAAGFRVRLLSARVFYEEGIATAEFDHLALGIDLDHAWLADVGFGDNFLEPLRARQ